MLAEPRRQRGAAAGLSRGVIVNAAERVIERNGFEGTSLRSVAVELGVTPGALYNHFPSKQALLDAVADEFLAREVLHRLPRSAEPLDQIRIVCRRLHAAGITYPQLLLSVIGHVPDRVDSAQLRVADVLLSALRDAGASEAQTPILYRALITLCAGNAVYDNHVGSLPAAEVKSRLGTQIQSSPYDAFVRYLRSWPQGKPANWLEPQLDLVLAAIKTPR